MIGVKQQEMSVAAILLLQVDQMHEISLQKVIYFVFIFKLAFSHS